MKRFYCVEGGQTKGPFSLDELKEKGLKSIDLVCPEGETNWVRIDSIEGWRDARPKVQQASLSDAGRSQSTGELKPESLSSLSEKALRKAPIEMRSSGNEVGAANAVNSSTPEQEYSSTADDLGLKQEQEDVSIKPTAAEQSRVDEAESIPPAPQGKSEGRGGIDVESDSELAAGRHNHKKMGFWEAYFLGWSRFSEFDGRSRRMEYWSWSVVNGIIVGILSVLGEPVSYGDSSSAMWSGLLGLCGLAMIIPGLALSVRRLHDIGFIGWWVLIGFLPFGSLLLIIFAFIDSQKGTNKWGLNPKGA